MLVRFRSNGGDITMFGEDALSLIRMMGHSGTVPSAILARDLPNALLRLEEGLAAAKTQEPPAKDSAENSDEEPPVPLGKRAFPLIELLKRCIRNGWDLLWERQNPQSYT